MRIIGAILHRSNLIDTLDGSGVGVFGDRQALGVTLKRGAYWLEDTARGGLETYTAVSKDWDRSRDEILKFPFGQLGGKWVGMTKDTLPK